MKVFRAVSVVFLAAPVFAQDAGPSILLRGEPLLGEAAQRVVLHPFMELAGIYDTGLFYSGENANGVLGGTASPGTEVTGGVTGGHSWEHMKLGLDYRGSLYRYTNATAYNASQQSMSLGLAYQFTRHTTLTLHENAGMFSGVFGLQGLPPGIGDLSSIFTTDYSNNRTKYLGTQADFTVQKSPRLSFNVGGFSSLTRRSSSALYGVTGAGARADLQYRLPGRSTIGLGYTYDHYVYHGLSGSTNIHSVLGSYAIRISRTLEFTAYGGAMRAEMQFLQAASVAPAADRVVSLAYVPNFRAALSQTYRRGVAYISGGRTVSAGNGVFLTSAATVANAGYTYTGSRRWTFNMQGEYYRAKSIGDVVGYYGDAGGTVTASRQISRYVHAVASFGARKYQDPDLSHRNRIFYQSRIGLGFTPRDIPLRVW